MPPEQVGWRRGRARPRVTLPRAERALPQERAFPGLTWMLGMDHCPERGTWALLLAACLAGAPDAGQAQPSTRPIERRQEQAPKPPEEPVPESPVRLPAFPRGEDLVELDAADFDLGVRVFLDPGSLSQPAPGVVRYTMLLVSATGTGNLFYESIDCERGEWRTLAFGTGAGTFELMREARWRSLEGTTAIGHRRALARNYICIRGRRLPDRAQDLRQRLHVRSAPISGGRETR